MNVFVVRYTHPDAPGWRDQLEAHTKWLLAQLEAGTLLASGPVQVDELTPDAAHAALLVLRVDTRQALDELLATDPYAVHGLVSSCDVQQWNPLFGALQAQSSLPGMLQKAPLGALLASFAG